jgi:FkbM family methyltransferase
VIAFEPVPVTFALLASNARLFSSRNVTLFNAAASDRTQVVGMSIPIFSSGLTNYYEAHVSDSAIADLAVLTIAIDALGITHRVSLVKIDAEGHEAHVINGMRELVSRDRPVLILESASREVTEWLTSLGYQSERLPGSPNLLFRQPTSSR